MKEKEFGQDEGKKVVNNVILKTNIFDIKIHPLKKISDQRGMVMHMLRCDTSHFSKFGEVYFSTIKENATKAWKKHLFMTQNLAVPVGKIKLVCFDDRKNSFSYGLIDEIYLGIEHFYLVTVPPLIWYGFQGIGACESLIANCTDMPHDPNEVVRKSESDESIPYKWF
ncbi:dTDP-4-dehydrorhamnose 3,5-epimerase [Fluviispira sanaruensis]|uniref:dTDP-4-dehydrorhamnose 3,5-epimerase n=1 Tax=Fluviispira sanaruensis TaxID=2493639 RepID=A0A4P2VQ41_FLUSA|nr:dTDP-4-dehydrorhamnose 3,5-epimerase [Fluviispira sanaruensis]BBH54059.1 dTDP-4-dehydrorhamnose 3,5-epimerase [Fluviispira sanaruensis]